MSKIAIVRVRGSINVKGDIKDTLTLLRLYRKNYCTIVEDNPTYKGMINKVKDFVTYGEISDEMHKEVVEKRGEEFKGRGEDRKGRIKYDSKFIVIDGKKIKPFFRLSPPKKGFGRKGIKVGFKSHGALGYRGDKINDLLKRMI
ncbi:50S ribosomal protein L30 [Candidatus Woesearchaeota archaeon]|nr:50S ribosomal protein L30 [Candidatus Woesearchaeota archaeon]